MKKSTSKSTDRVAFTVRIPRSLRDDLKFISLREGVSVQALAERRLRVSKLRRKPVDTSWLQKYQIGPLKIKGPLRRHVFYEA